MSQDCFKPLKDFYLYEVNAQGDVRKRTSKRPLTPMKTKSGDRFSLHDSGHILTIARSKLKYCYEHNRSPYELRGRVISQGQLMTISDHCEQLALMNAERIENYKYHKDKEDLLKLYEYNIRFLELFCKMLKKELARNEAWELSELVGGSIRKALVRYYRDKKEYRKEEIEDLAKDIFYNTFLEHCPFNMDCYIYEIVKRKLKNKKNE